MKLDRLEGKGWIMGIENIKLVKCKEVNVDAALGTLNLDANGSLKARVTRLAAFYQANGTTLDLAVCDVCGAESDASLDACPFCGDAGAVVEPETEQTDSALAGETENENAEPDDNAGGETEIATNEDDMAKGKAAKAPKAGKAAKAPTKAAAAPKVAKAPKEKLVTALAVAPPPKGKKGKAAPTVTSDGTVIVHDSTDLDAKVAEFREAALGGAVAFHRLGALANDIVTNSLWKQRVNDDGVPTFRNFKQFCVAELNMSAQHIYRAMAVAAQFKESDIAKLSGKQVRLVLEVPKESRAEIIEAAGRGEGTGALTERANALRGGRKPLPEPSKAITVALTGGHNKIKLYKRPNTGGAKMEVEGLPRAKKLADAPFGIMDLSNKVRMIVRVGTTPSGEMFADVEFRRGEPTL